jgi:DivIVA domain-containing protein
MTTPEGPVPFTRVRFWQHGYDIAAVDSFVARVLATVNGGPVTSPVTVDEVRTVAFNSTRFREGYAVAEVDHFLDQAIAWLSAP